MKKWPKVRLSEVMKTCIDAVPSGSLETVQLAGVYGFGRGLFARGAIYPLDTTYKCFHRLHAGDFVISMPKAWEGAIARVPRQFDGWFLSPVFPTFRAESESLDTRFLNWYCKQATIWDQLQSKAKGIGARRESVSAGQFLSLEIPLPSLAEQRSIVARLDAVTEKARQVAARLDAIEADAERLLAVRFHETIKEAPWKPLGEVAPVVRREVEIEPQQIYTELGVRSFFKGTFHRRTLVGSEFSWQKLYWIKQGDLIFSNIMAWEQAIAIAGAPDHDCVGNHRMLTCSAPPDIATAAYLWYYFTTLDGFAEITASSPGTAARNKTLTSDALMAIPVPVPPLTKQHTFNTLQAKVAAKKAKHAAIRKDLDALLPSMLERIFQSENC